MTDDRYRVLIAEADRAARVFLADNLAADGYDAEVSDDAEATIHLLVKQFDVLILDVNGATLEVVDTIRDGAHRRIDPQLPILTLTSVADEHHRIRLLERGADDALCKPYFYPELRARVGALVRRSTARRAPQVVNAGALRLDVAARRAWLHGVALAPMPDTQWRLLLVLASDPMRVFTRQELIRSLWGSQTAITQSRSRTLDSHAARLRRHLRADNEQYIRTVWGVGFRLAGPLEEAA